MTKMILVGGTGRSGTSITKKVLEQHPGAASLPFEYRFIIDPDGLVDFYASLSVTWSPYLADRRLKRLDRFLTNLGREPWHHRLLSRIVQSLNPDGKTLSPRAYHGWQLDQHLPGYRDRVRELISSLVEFSFPACWVGTQSYQRSAQIYHMPPRRRADLARILGGFVDGLIGDLLQQTGKTFFVEDNTWNILFARELLQLMPAARIVHVYRDPRDVVASFMQQRWSPSDATQAAYWYRDLMDHWQDVRSDLPAAAYYELSLEDLVASPEAVLRDLCTFAGISFNNSLLEVDLGAANTGRWRHEFAEQEAARVHDILADNIVDLGYSLE
jgi:hypothetical protein